MSKVYIGIDNGVSGSIGIIADSYKMLPTPIKKELSYTKTKQYINRVDTIKLNQILWQYVNNECLIVLERPMVNPTRFKATISAIRALEATLNTIEGLGLPYMYIDSKEWQKELLPAGIKGSPELKKASLDIGLRLFPKCQDIIKRQKDADSLLIAEYAKRKKL